MFSHTYKNVPLKRKKGKRERERKKEQLSLAFAVPNSATINSVKLAG